MYEEDIHIPDPFKDTIEECIESAVSMKDPFQLYLKQRQSSEATRKRPRSSSLVSLCFYMK